MPYVAFSLRLSPGPSQVKNHRKHPFITIKHSKKYPGVYPLNISPNFNFNF
jgi:hypothetical protein